MTGQPASNLLLEPQRTTAMTSPLNMSRRLDSLEAMQPDATLGKPVLWGTGQSLADALATANLTLADKPLFAIYLRWVKPGGGEQPECPHYLRDRHLLD